MEEKSMHLSPNQFSVPNGITCVIGSGGKTTFLRALAGQLSGNILLTTTTHIQPFEGIPLVESDPDDTAASLQDRLEQALQHSRVLCLGTPLFAVSETETKTARDRHTIGKLGPAPVEPGILLPLFDYILIEADGSRHHPLKAHRSFEPVIPAKSTLTVCIAGLSGLGQPAKTACHCADLFCRIAGTDPDEPVRSSHVARVLNEEDLADIYLLNQTDVLTDPTAALELCSYIKKPALAGSLQKRRFL